MLRSPYSKIKDAILGASYDLSLVWTNSKVATEMHLKWKKKPGPANILSFPLDKDIGEIFIFKNPKLKKDDFLSLFIHGCVHLKGFTHGSKMDQEEKKWQKEFNIG